ncbi:MAG: phosphoribosylaminoimidazolesuccinocarboxamide synthase [Peptococcaceae bacterium]|nr:phosphoribosylaminoimidazolesuccinocarboxamide synthase [Peptococcaceae bacterium]
MKKLEQIYEGKAKKVFNTDDERYYIVEYKDDATAFNGQKKGTIEKKGIINNRVTNHLMEMLEDKGIPTHFVKEISDRETVVKRVKIIPLEVIIRNVAAGSMAKRLGLKEGTPLACTVLEFSYKDDDLGDPLINDTYVLALELCTEEELEKVKEMAYQVNRYLSDYLKNINIQLVDFKLEFGKTAEGKVVLADEISPDTCRFWDATTGEKLDKDRFRRDMGGVEEAYQEIMKRMLGD